VTLHHLELWVPDLVAAQNSLGWLFEALGYLRESSWADGSSYRKDDFYLVLESGPDVLPGRHERRAPGLNHLAFSVSTRDEVDTLSVQAQERGFRLLFADKHPFAGGAHHYASYLEDPAGYEIELVAVT